MIRDLLFGLSALISLVPALLLGFRREAGRDAVFWSAIVVAVLGPASWSAVQIGDAWRTGLSANLWVSISISMALFSCVAIVSQQAWRLASLLAAYMLLLAVLAIAWQQAPVSGLNINVPAGWVAVHIGFSVSTFGLVTIAAVSAFAAFLKERALKAKQPNTLSRSLPSVVDCEHLLVRLLEIGEVVLGLGLATGMAVHYAEAGNILPFDHKVILTVSAFVVIGGLLIAHYRSGMRGRMAARLVLMAYLLLTLGYPGVKFVTDILLP